MVDYSAIINNWFSGQNFSALLTMFMWSFGALIIIGVSIKVIKDLIKYQYRGVVQKRRQSDWMTGNPSSRKVEGKAGYFTEKGLPVFRIKYGLMPWQIINIKKLPDTEYMQDNTAYFLQYNVGEFVQAKLNIDWDTETVKVEPVDSTTKAGAKQDLVSYNNIFNTRSRLQENLGIAILGFIIVGGLIAYYFVNQACSA